MFTNGTAQLAVRPRYEPMSDGIETRHEGAHVGARPSIGFFVRSLSGGGAQRDAILLANAMADAGFASLILTLEPNGSLRNLVSERVEVVDVKARRLATAVFALARAIEAAGPKIVFSSETAANLVAFAAVRRVPAHRRPKIFLREVTSPSIARRLDPYLQNRLAFRFVGRVYSKADRVLTLTEGARRDLIENFGVPADRITHFTSNAVIDLPTEARLQDATAAPPRQRGLVVAIGRLSPEKDHLTLIRAIADVRARRREPLQLVIAGEGPMRSELEREIATLDLGSLVQLVGATDDAFAWLLKAELAVSSSRFEGLGNVIIEALACGTPVVSTDCPYGPREILENGRLGLLVPVGDPSALSRAIEAALAQKPDRAMLRDAARRFTSRQAALSLATILEAT
jgi:glycosyltransferase involved in cell wall biosynthesis